MVQKMLMWKKPKVISVILYVLYSLKNSVVEIMTEYSNVKKEHISKRPFYVATPKNVDFI